MNHKVGDWVEYYPGYLVRITAVHQRHYGTTYDAVGEDGVHIAQWRGADTE